MKLMKFIYRIKIQKKRKIVKKIKATNIEIVRIQLKYFSKMVTNLI